MNFPIIFGHRGASSLEPENTMKAFDRALQDGADGIEFDVRKTADDELVIIHDQRINRTSNGRGRVSKISYSNLLKYDFGKEEKIPLLRDVLKLYGNKHWLNVEVKEIGFENQLVEMLKELKINKKLVVSSFKIPVLNKLKELTDEIPTAYLFNRETNDLKKLIKNVDTNDIHPGKHFVNKTLIDNAHKLNIQVRVWTVDDRITARKLTEWGVDGIMTNNPKEIIKFLKDK
ncbi:MAG: glycerophosphodiester phosphodiesterase [Candidatus Heimdallarchaeota archaeon]